MKQLSSFLFLTLLFGGSLTATAADHSKLILSYRSLGYYVPKRNPDLKAARLLIGEARGKSFQAGRRSNPELSVGVEGNRSFRDRRAEIAFTQQFPLTNHLRLEKELSIFEIEAAALEVQIVERQFLKQAREAVVVIYFLREKMAMLMEQKKLAEELAGHIEKAAKKAEHSPLDAGQARLEVNGYFNEVQKLKVKEAEVEGILKKVLGLAPNTAIYLGGDLPTSHISTGNKNYLRRPDYRLALLKIKAAQKGVELEKARRLDDLSVGAIVGIERREDVPKGYETEGIIGLQASIKLPIWNKNKGNIASAKAKKERYRKEAAAYHHAMVNQIQTLKKQVSYWKKLLDNIDRKSIPMTKKQVEDSRKAYFQGQGDFQTMLRAKKQEVQILISRLEAKRELHKTRVSLEIAASSNTQ